MLVFLLIISYEVAVCPCPSSPVPQKMKRHQRGTMARGALVMPEPSPRWSWKIWRGTNSPGWWLEDLRLHVGVPIDLWDYIGESCFSPLILEHFVWGTSLYSDHPSRLCGDKRAENSGDGCPNQSLIYQHIVLKSVISCYSSLPEVRGTPQRNVPVLRRSEKTI